MADPVNLDHDTVDRLAGAVVARLFDHILEHRLLQAEVWQLRNRSAPGWHEDVVAALVPEVAS